MNGSDHPNHLSTMLDVTSVLGAGREFSLLTVTSGGLPYLGCVTSVSWERESFG
jgi:hypothetical protein